MNENTAAPRYDWTWRHLAALLGGNFALALGPWSVRLSDAGPVATGFWRLTLALPLLLLLAMANRQKLVGFSRRTWFGVAGAGLFFAADLAAWHVGIHGTRLGNASLFGNSGSLILMVWGVIALRRAPHRGEWLALGAASAGAAILFGRSLEISTETLVGDLLCLLAGFFYAFYILLLQSERAQFGNWSLLFWSSAAGAPFLLAAALWMGETVMPHNWWPLFALALGSQIIGQGLLVYALRHFPPLIIGLTLLTQPSVSIVAGWFAFNETLGAWDLAGMILVAAALVLARAGEKPAAS
ncbi:DMT family transporter [Novosphingobium sp. JCM 18896]|uniref:DMT family transporter n=1 Tax=Novosphingobium sp. JCM 18896 TaxID=2989731 RepID=UPI002223B440|nr:DMT family transporter [Novosphingobium sp. JCM 18896]MCW1429836.1 DMT family transporter [Novosphingobium sp. JCM 18896]